MPDTQKPHERFPNIMKAALEISYDNGGINCERSEEDLKRELSAFIERNGEQGYDFRASDAWLGSLSEEDLMTACCGEETDTKKIMERAPPRTDELLNAIFEEVG